MNTLHEDITDASKSLIIFLSLYLISFFWIWLEECKYENMMEEFLTSGDSLIILMRLKKWKSY